MKTIIHTVYKLMGRKVPRGQTLGGTRLVVIADWVPVEDAETAVREANAMRQAWATYKRALQAFRDNDIRTVNACLRSVKEDDDSPGATLVRSLLHELRASNQRKWLAAANEDEARKSDANEKRYCRVADELCLSRRGKYEMAMRVRETLLKRGEEVSTRTIVRAFNNQNYS